MTLMLRTTRKVQKSERGSYCITLPNDWAQAVGLANGSVVEVLYGGRRVVISPLSATGDPS
jgi:antitoxin component of MazEF toxin-antitoxin module